VGSIRKITVFIVIVVVAISLCHL